MKEKFHAAKLEINRVLADIVRYNKKVRVAYFTVVENELWFFFKYKRIPLKYWMCAVKPNNPDDNIDEFKYKTFLEELSQFVTRGTHLKMMKNPLKMMSTWNLKIGEIQNAAIIQGQDKDRQEQPAGIE